MAPRHLGVLGVILLCFAVVVTALVQTSEIDAAAPQPRNDTRWPNYVRTCTPFRLYGHTSSSTDTEPLLDVDSAQVLIPWGAQVEVTCEGSDGARALVCFHQDDDVGYSAAYNLKFNPNFGSSGNCGDGCGNYDDSSGGSGVDAHASCFLVLDGQSKFRRLDQSIFYGRSTEVVPTGTAGRCTVAGARDAGPNGVVGGPCYADTDCADNGGTCTTDRLGPQGAWMAFRVSNTSLTCSVELCI